MSANDFDLMVMLGLIISTLSICFGAIAYVIWGKEIPPAYTQDELAMLLQIANAEFKKRPRLRAGALSESKS